MREHGACHRGDMQRELRVDLLLLGRRSTEQPERHGAAGIEEDRKSKGDAIAAGQVEAPPRQPRAERRTDAGADRDRPEDRAKLRPRKKVRRLRRYRRPTRAPGQAEEARVEPEQQMLIRRGDEHRASDAEDRGSIGDHGRQLAPATSRPMLSDSQPVTITPGNERKAPSPKTSAA